MFNVTTCWSCGTGISGAKTCGRCHTAAYCSKLCQIKDWKPRGHREFCPPLCKAIGFCNETKEIISKHTDVKVCVLALMGPGWVQMLNNVILEALHGKNMFVVFHQSLQSQLYRTSIYYKDEELHCFDPVPGWSRMIEYFVNRLSAETYKIGDAEVCSICCDASNDFSMCLVCGNKCCRACFRKSNLKCAFCRKQHDVQVPFC